LNRSFLVLVGLIFLGYGVTCALDPDLAARLAGLAVKNGDGYAELSAMYGGLQSGVGLFLAIAAFQQRLHRPALLLLVLGIGFLAAMRALGALRTDELVTAYTWGALAFETFVTAGAAALLLKSR
jgi:hypothetical protein